MMREFKSAVIERAKINLKKAKFAGEQNSQFHGKSDQEYK